MFVILLLVKESNALGINTATDTTVLETIMRLISSCWLQKSLFSLHGSCSAGGRAERIDRFDSPYKHVRCDDLGLFAVATQPIKGMLEDSVYERRVDNGPRGRVGVLQFLQR
jgi:hypothetical protein